VEWVTDSNAKSAFPLVEPIAPPEPAPPVRRPSPVTGRWKLKAVLALAALAALTLLVGLSNENSYVSRTRLGKRLRDNVLPPHQVSERPLTANPDDVPVTSSAISPDGKYLAFTDKTGFYLRQIEGGETHVVPLPKGFDALAESWFPDSTTGAHATGLKSASSALTTFLASPPSACINQISLWSNLPDKNAIFEPSGETLAPWPSSASFLGVPPMMEISQRLDGFLGSSTQAGMILIFGHCSSTPAQRARWVQVRGLQVIAVWPLDSV
jgi:hypothetical protein